mgnify:CR=1 FL=1
MGDQEVRYLETMYNIYKDPGMSLLSERADLVQKWLPTRYKIDQHWVFLFGHWVQSGGRQTHHFAAQLLVARVTPH